MATSTRPSRRAAQAVSYTTADPESSEDDKALESSDEEEEYGRKGKGRASKARKKQKLALRLDSDGSDLDTPDTSDSDALSPRQFAYDRSRKKDDVAADKVKYSVPRVNPVNRLPVELLCQIFSYLHAATLSSLSKTSRQLRLLLTAKASAHIWRHAMRPHIVSLRNSYSPVTPLSASPRPIPQVAGEDVPLVGLASALFDRKCAYCGKLNVMRGDRYLLRTLCTECRTANFVLSTDIAKGKDKKLEDLHPATVQAVVPTYLPPGDLRWGRSRPWILVPDLFVQSEILEELQMEDDGDVEGLVKEGVDAKEVNKTLGQIKGLKRRRWHRRLPVKGAKQLETELVDKYSPRVKEYILERKALIKDRDALADWIYVTGDALYDERDLECAEASTFKAQVGAFRREAIVERFGKERVFELGATQRHKLASFDLAIKPEPLTDDIWLAIKGPIYRFIARDVAQNIFTRVGKKLKDDRDEDDEDEGLFKKPESVTKAGWAYVRPELVKVAKEYELKKQEHAAEQLKLKALAPKGPRLSATAVAAKEPFFAERFNKCFAMTSSKQAGWTMPRYAEFRLLPTVVELWNDPAFAVDPSDAGRDLDIKQWGKFHLETVLEEMAGFALDSRGEALRSILAATTDLGEDDDAVAAFDAVEALCVDGEYGDDFFRRASSYVSCAKCPSFFGPLLEVFKHVHVAHPLESVPYVPSLKREPVTLAELGPRVDLSLEVSCAWSAILELAQLDDTDDGLVTDAQLDAAFKDKKLVWENGPRGTKRRGTWKDVLWRVTQAARNAHEESDVLDVPVIAVKNLTRRERVWGGGGWGRYGRGW
ncbi:hypothetical protein JCM8208_004245 [Rhodotorula glutinis]